jgi:hypothetical protein
VSEAVIEQVRGAYTVSTDPSRLDLAAVRRYLAAAYWSPGLPRDVLTRAVAGSLCFGVRPANTVLH